MNFKKTVAELLQVALDKNPSLFLIDLKIGADNSIVVLLDGDEGVTLESCVAVSRQIEHNIDREEHDFSLEVSSVGIGSELTIPRQYIKNKGRKLEVISLDDNIFKGNLTQADQESITLVIFSGFTPLFLSNNATIDVALFTERSQFPDNFESPI